VKRAYRLALICGAAPLAVGAAIFLLWLVTRWDQLVVAGVATIYGGVACFAVGLGALVRYYILATRAAEPVPRRKLGSDLAVALLLLFANYPLALGIIGGAMAIETRYTVIVRNDTTQPLAPVRIEGGGAKVSIVTLAPQERTERTLWFQAPGELRLETTLGEKKVSAVIEGYVTRGLGGRAEARVRADGSVEVTRIPRRSAAPSAAP
jgi:hypothetical protein